MVLLRILLFLARVAFGLIVLYYVTKLIISWLLRGGSKQRIERKAEKDDDGYYKYLTNQEIEDADFEEIDPREEEN